MLLYTVYIVRVHEIVGRVVVAANGGGMVAMTSSIRAQVPEVLQLSLLGRDLPHFASVGRFWSGCVATTAAEAVP